MDSSKRLQEITDLKNSVRGLPIELQAKIWAYWADGINERAKQSFFDQRQLDTDRLYQRFQTEPSSNPWFWDPQLRQGLDEIANRRKPEEIADLYYYQDG